MNDRTMFATVPTIELAWSCAKRTQMASAPVCWQGVLWACLLPLLWVPAGWAQPTPQLQALSQHVGQAGTTVPVQVLAADQGEQIGRLVFSHPDITAKLLTEPASDPAQVSTPKYGHFEVSIGPQVAAGIYDVSVVGAAGISNPRAFWVTTQQVVVPDAAAVDSPAGAALELDRVVWERFRGPQPQRFHLSLTAGQAVELIVYAQSLDSNALPVLVLRNEAGQEVARGRAAKQTPARVRFAVPSDGRYLVEVQDMLYQGGADYYYALLARAIDLPAESVETATASEIATETVTETATETVAVGTEGGVVAEATELAVDRGLVDWTQSLHQRGDRRQRLAIRQPSIVSVLGDWAAGAGGLDFSSVQPNSSPGGVSELPVVVAGVFPERPEPVRVDFQGSGGQVVWCEVVSAGAEQWTDPQLLLYRVRTDEQGVESLQLLTHQDDAPGVGTGPVNIASPDPAFVATLPEEGRYCVLVMDQVTSPRLVEQRRFVVSVAAPQPDFQLVSHPLFFNNDPAQSRPLGIRLVPGGTAAWHVHVLRRQGFAGAIELTVEGLPEGVQAVPVIVHPGVNQATVVVQGTEDLGPWCGAVRIVGRGIGEPALRRVAWPAAMFQAASPRRDKIRWGLVAETRLSTIDGPLAPLGMSWAAATVSLVPGEAATAVLDLQRREGGAGQGIVRPVQLPPGWSVSEVTIPPDQTQGSITIQVPADTVAGRYSVSFHNETKLQWKVTPESAAQEVAVWLPVPALVIEVAPRPAQ